MVSLSFMLLSFNTLNNAVRTNVFLIRKRQYHHTVSLRQIPHFSRVTGRHGTERLDDFTFCVDQTSVTRDADHIFAVLNLSWSYCHYHTMLFDVLPLNYKEPDRFLSNLSKTQICSCYLASIIPRSMTFKFSIMDKPCCF